MPNMFAAHGSITPEGERVIQYMEAQIHAAEQTDNIETLNALAGPIKHYYVNVVKLSMLKPAAWLEDYGSAAQAMYRNLTEAEAAANSIEADRADRARLSESLDEVKAALAVAMAKIAEMEAKQVAADQAEDAAEMESAPAEAEESAPKRGKRA